MSVWGQIINEHAKLGSTKDLDESGNVVESVKASNDNIGDESKLIKLGDRVTATTMGRMQKTHTGTVVAIKKTTRGQWIDVAIDSGGNLLTRASLVKHL